MTDTPFATPTTIEQLVEWIESRHTVGPAGATAFGPDGTAYQTIGFGSMRPNQPSSSEERALLGAFWKGYLWVFKDPGGVLSWREKPYLSYDTEDGFKVRAYGRLAVMPAMPDHLDPRFVPADAAA